MKFDECKSPSKVVLSLLHDYLHKGYCVTLENYYTSPELADVLVSCETGCYGTLRKKQGLPNQNWEWKPKKGDPPKSQFKGEVGVMQWNDASKTKPVKFVSILSSIHTFEMVDSNKIDRSTGAVIQTPDVIMVYNVTVGSIDLVSRVLILYSSQRSGVKWYGKIAELYLDISEYNSFILWKKTNPDKRNVDHLSYRKLLIEEIVMFHLCPPGQILTLRKQI